MASPSYGRCLASVVFPAFLFPPRKAAFASDFCMAPLLPVAAPHSGVLSAASPHLFCHSVAAPCTGMSSAVLFCFAFSLPVAAPYAGMSSAVLFVGLYFTAATHSNVLRAFFCLLPSPKHSAFLAVVPLSAAISPVDLFKGLTSFASPYLVAAPYTGMLSAVQLSLLWTFLVVLLATQHA